MRFQILLAQIPVFVAGFFVLPLTYSYSTLLHLLLGCAIVYQSIILAPYILKRRSNSIGQGDSIQDVVSILSVNVLQTNEQYEKLIDLVRVHQPDILLTMESDKKWERALSVLDGIYPHFKKVALDNTYGMHFYTRLEADFINVHYLISDQRPSIEAHLRTSGGTEFTFFGIHPPPPSPTEEETSKQKDGELMMLAKKIRKLNCAVLVAGDFNSVCWSRASKLFGRVSGLQDARIGRGLISTFPANWPLFRFPIDLMFHSKQAHIQTLETLGNIGSDHFPLYSQVAFQPLKEGESNKETVDQEVMSEADSLIEDGKDEAESDQ